MLTNDLTLGIIEYVSSLVSGFEDLTGEWTLIGQSIFQRVVYNSDGSVVHEKPPLLNQIVNSVEITRCGRIGRDEK